MKACAGGFGGGEFAMRWDAVFRFGVECGEDVCLLRRAGGFVVLYHLHDQVGDGAAAFFRGAHFGA
jgi:hypothetical protein